VIYVGAGNGRLYALNPDGTERWRFAAGSRVISSPMVANGIVYFGSWDGKFYALRCSSNGLARSPWPTFHHDPQRTGRAE
jgi:outer membrane protein assembly factor BamB